MPDPAPTPEPSPTPSPTPAPAPPPAPAPEPKQDETDPAKALKAELDNLKKEIKSYKDKEKAAADAELSAAEKLAKRDAELAEAKREALIERVRRSNGFADKVYDVVAAKGETEDEVKAAYEAHKAALDEYVKAQGVKAAPGGGTGGGKAPDGKTEGEKKGLTFLERKGYVNRKNAV